MPNDYNNPRTFPCPHCGCDVPAAAKQCRACGASDDCGWADDAGYDSDFEMSDEDDEFDYDRFVAREFPDHADRPLTTDQKPWIKLVVLVMIVSFLLTVLAF